MESARVRYLRTSFLIQKQRVRKYRTKHFPCCNLFILYLLRFFNPNQIFTLHQAEQTSSYVFIPSECKHVASLNPSVNIFRTFHLASRAFNLFPLPCSFTSFASSFQAFPCLVKLVVVEKGLRHICLLQNFSCLFLLLKNSLSKLTSRSIGFLSKSFCSALPGCSF